ncbi:reverse transcriptase domain-containing protein [Tanacetum coccineum]
MTDAAIKGLIAQGVADALAEYEAVGMNTIATIQEVAKEDKCLLLFEKMEFVFHISNYTVACQNKFTTCTLLGSALMWWNSHIKTVGHNAAYGMPWKTLMKMLTDKYCPRSEIKKLEIEIWNLKVKGTDVVSYKQHFQELALMCGGMFPEESDQLEKYVGGLLDMIQGSVMTSKPKSMQEAIEITNDLMDQKAEETLIKTPTKQVYQPVSKKPTANASVNKKKNVEPAKEVSKSNPFEVLTSVENDMELGENKGHSNLASQATNSRRSSFWSVDASSPSTTPIVEKIDKIENLIIEGKGTLVDDEGKPLEKVASSCEYDSEDEVALVDNKMANFLAKKDGYGTQSLLKQWTESYENADYGYDPYDDDMYEV